MELFVNPWSIILLSTGIISALSGFILKKYPPKSINWFYGYRTRNSMKSQERWDFAQVLGGRELIRSGAILFILGLPGHWLPLPITMAVWIALILVIAFLCLPVLRVEAGLKRKFKD